MADDRSPVAGTVEEGGSSPAERMGRAFTDWLHDRPRRDRRWRFEPVEAALFSIVAAVGLLILGGLVGAVGDFSSFSVAGAYQVQLEIASMTAWADLPLAAILLGAALLAWYQCAHLCEQVKLYQDATEDTEVAAEVDALIAQDLRQVRRSRITIVFVGLFGLMTGVAALVRLIYLLSSLHLPQTPQWYSYFGIVVQTLAIVVPAFACVAIGPKVWARGSGSFRVGGVDGG